MLLLNNATINYTSFKGVKFQDIYIKTKRNHIIYEFDRRIREGTFKELGGKYGYIMRYKQVGNEENKDYFILVPATTELGAGIFVSNYVFFGKPTSKCYEQLMRELGSPVSKTKEQAFLEQIHLLLYDALPNCYVERVENIDDTMRLKLTNTNVRKIYAEYCGLNKNKPYLKPDFKVINTKTNKLSFLEVELTWHKEEDFMKKLMKIRMLGRRTYFVFNGEKNEEYHLELIAKFERQISKKIGKTFKFTSIYHATIDELSFSGENAWKKYV